MLVLLVFVAGCEGTIDKADKAFEAGNFDKAISLYRQSLEEKKHKAPEMAEIHFKIGRATDQLGKYDLAVDEYRTAVELKPDELKYYMAMADDLDRLGMYEEEVSVLRNVLILDKNNPHAEAMLGTSYAKLGQYMNALEEFKSALQHNPRDAQNYNNLGMVYDSLGDTEKAINFMEEGLKLSPDDNFTLQNIGAIYNKVKRYGDSARAYARLVKLKPEVAKFHNQLGIAYYNNGQYKQAYAEFKAVENIDAKFPGLQDNVKLAQRGMNRSAK